MALTRAQIETNFKNLINYAETMSSYLATRMDTLDSNLLSSANGVRFAQSLAAAKNWRTTAGQSLSANLVAPLLSAQWTEVADFLNLPLTTPFVDLLNEFRDDMITNSKSVNSRGITLGTPSATGGNTGTGELIRLKVDDNDQTLEACHVESQRLDIIADQSNPLSQGRHNELGYFSGSTNPLDFWTASKFTTSGLTTQLKVSSESDSLLQNSSFDNFSPFESPFTGPLTSLSGWTTGTGTIGTDFGINSTGVAGTDYFTSNAGASKPASLKVLTTTAASIYQNLSVTTRFDYRVPCIPILYYNREIGGAAGDLTITWGSKSQTLTLAAQTGWNRFPITLDKKLYPKNWLNDQPRFTISWDLSAGTLLLDKCIFKPMFQWDGSWYVLVGGATPFVTGDSFTWSNTLGGADGILQKWFGILYGFSFPHNGAGAETWTDPTVIP